MNLAKHSYLYLLELPLVLHIPSLHAIAVHAGLLPNDPLKSSSDASQPLVSASSLGVDTEVARTSEEISILIDVPQNQDPWTLLNMRSVYTTGKRKGKVTKSSKNGTPWSDVWKDEMQRCNGPGKWFGEAIDEWTAEHSETEDEVLDEVEDAATDELAGQGEVGRQLGRREELLSELDCSPVTVIYGHAGELIRSASVETDANLAGRGLDIKPFSKGLDSGCVVSEP